MNANRTKGRVLSAVLIVALAALALVTAKSYLDGRQGDFRHFYEAALAVRSGEDIYASHKGGYVYPPLLAVALTPLSLLTMSWAGAVWAVINGAMIVVAARLCAREMTDDLDVPDDGALAQGAAVVGLLVLVDKGRSALNMGQTDPLVLLLCVAALRCVMRRPLVCGLCLAAAVLVKYQALIFIPYLLMRRRWIEGGSAIAWIAVLALSTTAVFGWERNLAYLDSAIDVMREVLTGNDAEATADPNSLTWDRSVSIPSVIARTVGEGGMNTVISLTLLIAMLIAGVVVVMYRLRGVPLLAAHGVSDAPRPRARLAIEWAGLVVAVVVFSPQTEARHMLLTLPLTTLAAVILLADERRAARWMAGGAMLLLAAGLYLPPGGKRFDEAVDVWRAIGGASWCLLVSLLAILWVALPRAATPSRLPQHDNAQAGYIDRD